MCRNIRPLFNFDPPATDHEIHAAALQFVFGWSKSLPVSIGRPGLRVMAHGVESAVMIPLVVVLGREWGATGAAGGVLASTVVFCLIWVVLLAQIRATAAAAT